MPDNHRVQKQSQSDAAHRAYLKTKYNPSALDLQRQQLTSLLKNPSKPVHIPAPGATLEQRKRELSPPPEIVSNVAGSSAGAGSGEFHVYKHARRKEFARLALFEEEAAAERDAAEFKNKQDEWAERDRKKTEKNRKRRMKRGTNSNKKINTSSNSGDKPQQQDKKLATTLTAEEKGPKDGELAKNNEPAAQEQLNKPAEPVIEISAAVIKPSGIEIIDDDF
ncbi:hypothetical protein D0Z00_003557 [Geotrichum galactomycetum]|uniref:Uncharacterized protein n=1 Tax=Geotrichum galactomycetum TaxID=27317 RepID=A0ACB6V119_9ASCO|nr:hypothetical protein D0Z00_003557 [Geotrichum candidum]